MFCAGKKKKNEWNFMQQLNVLWKKRKEYGKKKKSILIIRKNIKLQNSNIRLFFIIIITGSNTRLWKEAKNKTQYSFLK